MIVRMLPPPAVPAAMAQGTNRGGVFDAPWAPPDFIGPGFPDVPFDASTPHRVPLNVQGRPMQFTSTLPQPMGAYTVEMADPPPIPIGPYHPSKRPSRGGIFAGVGASPIERMPMARPEWTKWKTFGQLRASRRAIDRRFIDGVGGCGCSY